MAEAQISPWRRKGGQRGSGRARGGARAWGAPSETTIKGHLFSTVVMNFFGKGPALTYLLQEGTMLMRLQWNSKMCTEGFVCQHHILQQM